MRKTIQRRLSTSAVKCPHCDSQLPIKIGTLAGHPLPPVVVMSAEKIIAIMDSVEKTGLGFCSRCVLEMNSFQTATPRMFWLEPDRGGGALHGPLCGSCFEDAAREINNEKPLSRIYSATVSGMSKIIGNPHEADTVSSPMQKKTLNSIDRLNDHVRKLQAKTLI